MLRLSRVHNLITPILFPWNDRARFGEGYILKYEVRKMMVADIKERDKDVKLEELRPADILLIHTRRSLWGWLIRRGTHCYWNHALMVYSTDKIGRDYRDALVIDAKTDASIVLRKLSDYVSRPDKYDMAVKRLNDELLDGDRTINLLDNICRTAANEVRPELTARLVRVKNRIFRQCTVIWRFTRRKLHKACQQPNMPWNVRPSQVKTFTCSGFVQWCYYMGASRIITINQDYRRHQSDVIFNSRIAGNPTPFELLTTTPADLANCEKLSWVYVVKHGVKYS